MSIDPKAGLDQKPETPGDGYPQVNALGQVYTTRKAKNVQLAFEGDITKYIESLPKAAETATKVAPLAAAPEVAGGLVGGAAIGGLAVGTGVIGISRMNGAADMAIREQLGANVGQQVGVAHGYSPFFNTPMDLDLRAVTPAMEAERKKAEEELRKKKENVAVTDPCKIGRYGDMKPGGKDPCPPGSDAHHVPADYVFRYGTRNDAGSRMPEVPSIDDGLSICLPKDEHQAAHRIGDPAVAKLGGTNGYAPLGDVLDTSIDAVDKAKKKKDDLWKKCMEKLKKEADDKYKNKRGWPVRTTKSPPGDPRDVPDSGAGDD